MVPDDGYDGSGAYPYADADEYGYAAYGVPEDQFVAFWTFVPEDHVFAPRIRDVVAPRGSYRTFLAHTAERTQYAVERGRVVNRSFDVARYERATGQHVLAVPAARLFHRGVPMQTTSRGRETALREAHHAGPLLGHRSPAFGAAMRRPGRRAPAFGPTNAFGSSATGASSPFGGRRAAGGQLERRERTPFGGSNGSRPAFATPSSPFGGSASADRFVRPSRNATFAGSTRSFGGIAQSQPEPVVSRPASFGGIQQAPRPFGTNAAASPTVQQRPARTLAAPQQRQATSTPQANQCRKHCR
jgi:hypothetical protein